MKLFDARKLATPGRIVTGDMHGVSRMLVLDKKTSDGRFYDVGGIFVYGENDPRPALLAHAYNMLPELVEALEAYVEADWQASGENSGVYGRHKLEELEKLIARAKEVPGI